jgi:glycosyltransferase involved in cell wall biosynthesis
MGIGERVALERHNLAVFRALVDKLDPDCVNWWAMGGMSLSLIELARRLGLPAAGVVVDDWMRYGPRVDLWSRATARPLVATVAERLWDIPTRVDLGEAARWLFVSETVRRRALAGGAPLPRSEVVHAGIDPGLFRQAEPRPWEGRLLYLGRIDPRKGIDTAIRALTALPEARLVIVGSGDDEYREELRRLAAGLGVADRVELTRRPRAELPSAYAEADAVLFPVRWEEPWGLVPLEAMAVGRPVIATATGGSGEYMRHEGNCLVYGPPEDAGELAAAVRRLARDDQLRARLRAGGLATSAAYTEERFNNAVMACLRRAVADASPAGAAQMRPTAPSHA